MMKKINWLIGLSLLGVVSCPGDAIAHGANIEYKSTSALQINATYDSGQPMANAQVTIYAPNDPATPWLTGMTDENGGFIFVPDPTKVGNWEVKVRQAGHGDIISIPGGNSPTAINQNEPNAGSQSLTQNQQSVSSHKYTPMQKGLMIVSVGWGFVGTALFFSRKSLEQQH
jgi:nickel transport protein